MYWSDFRKRVLKRDKYKCQKCFKNKDLVIHHITPVSEGGKKFDMCNCITLCKKCEKKEHRINKPQTFLESILDNSEIIPEGSD
ncbi:HNH endonuclease [candidate division WOR-3 bacterium]|nr:HNH endonuclease [candidate division WOR-3 bacterium]